MKYKNIRSLQQIFPKYFTLLLLFNQNNINPIPAIDKYISVSVFLRSLPVHVPKQLVYKLCA